MNQPDNGFYEGPNPEWATLHSTDSRGTEQHRQYHRDAVKSLNLWLEQNRQEKGTESYDSAHRLVVQERNANHRAFHTEPDLFIHTTTPSNEIADPVEMVLVEYTYSGRPSRRSIISAAQARNNLAQSR